MKKLANKEYVKSTDFPKIEATVTLDIISVKGPDYDYHEEVTIANDPQRPYLVNATWFNEQYNRIEKLLVWNFKEIWDFEEDGNFFDIEEVKRIIAIYAEALYIGVEYVEVDGIRRKK